MICIKALTIRQPYASFMDAGLKTIECRSWSTKHRGPLLICSGLSVAQCDYEIPEDKWDYYPLGVALCVVDVLEVVPFTKQHLEAAVMEEMPDQPCYAWVLGDVRQIEPFDVRGKPGLFEVDYEG